MIKFTILYHEPADTAAFEQFYTASLALMERLPNILRREVSHVYGAPGGSSPYYRSLELYFADRETLDQAMRSEEGVEAGRHLMAHAARLAELYFSEVYEEEGGSTPPAA